MNKGDLVGAILVGLFVLFCAVALTGAVMNLVTGQ